jgi:putative SOS response-associated peptidase YedK
MCERYVTPEPAQAEREFGVSQRWWKFSPSFNVGPSRNVPVVRRHDGETEGVMLRWGLIPDWAEADARKGWAASVSAQAADHSTVTRGAWERSRRCIVPMFGFYTWRLTSQQYRQPYFVRLVNRPAFGVAALWDRTVAENSDDVIESCALLTVPVNSLIAQMQDAAAEMPAILQRKDYELWLTASPAAAKSALQTCRLDSMVAHPVSPRVNSPIYDDVQLIRPFVRGAHRSQLTQTR